MAASYRESIVSFSLEIFPFYPLMYPDLPLLPRPWQLALANQPHRAGLQYDLSGCFSVVDIVGGQVFHDSRMLHGQGLCFVRNDGLILIVSAEFGYPLLLVACGTRS